jgi:hypothetical protein
LTPGSPDSIWGWFITGFVDDVDPVDGVDGVDRQVLPESGFFLADAIKTLYLTFVLPNGV